MLHELRRLADKGRRRLCHLAGRPDNSPWVLSPAARKAEQTYVDFMFALDYLGPMSKLVNMFHEAMSRYGLSVLLVNKHNVDKVLQQVETGWLRPHVFLDLCSACSKPIETLLRTAAKQGIHTIGNPERLDVWTLKAKSHPLLEQAGMPVPPTVILQASEPTRDLSAGERAILGDRVVIKPSFGVAAQGTVVGVEPTIANIDKARQFNPKDDWLIQKMVSWIDLGKQDGYMRAYNILGHRALVWWSLKGNQGYRLMTWNDFYQHDLRPALSIVDKVEALSGIEFFSVEIAMTADSGSNRFTMIDYCNDQCDMDPTGDPSRMPPEPLIRWMCERFAEYTYCRKFGLPANANRTLYLHS